VAAFGLAGYLVLAATVPTRGLLTGAAILATGAAWYAARRFVAAR